MFVYFYCYLLVVLRFVLFRLCFALIFGWRGVAGREMFGEGVGCRVWWFLKIVFVFRLCFLFLYFKNMYGVFFFYLEFDVI